MTDVIDAATILDIPIIDIKDYIKQNPEKEKPNKCMWALDNIHDQVVGVALLFDGQIKVPICDRHLTWHRGILTLHKAGMDVEELIKMSREEIFKELINRGLVPIKQ